MNENYRANLIKSISYDQDEIIKNIMRLYTGEIEVDPTYSKGVFYRNLPEPQLKFDKNPIGEDVVEADCRDLPLEDESVNSIMFDPPFIATTGKSHDEKKKGRNIIVERFGRYTSMDELYQFYGDSLQEFARVLKTGGYLVVKIQDVVSSGKQYLSHVEMINRAEKAGFHAEDLFVLLAKSRLIGHWKTQKHARKFHSYFIVFKKAKAT